LTIRTNSASCSAIFSSPVFSSFPIFAAADIAAAGGGRMGRTNWTTRRTNRSLRPETTADNLTNGDDGEDDRTAPPRRKRDGPAQAPMPAPFADSKWLQRRAMITSNIRAVLCAALALSWVGCSRSGGSVFTPPPPPTTTICVFFPSARVRGMPVLRCCCTAS
jgi:hypothetical protein